jgi:hypothetical protein
MTLTSTHAELNGAEHAGNKHPPGEAGALSVLALPA